MIFLIHTVYLRCDDFIELFSQSDTISLRKKRRDKFLSDCTHPRVGKALLQSQNGIFSENIAKKIIKNKDNNSDENDDESILWEL